MTLKLQPTDLVLPVAQALNKPAVEILDWQSTPLTGGGSTYRADSVSTVKSRRKKGAK